MRFLLHNPKPRQSAGRAQHTQRRRGSLGILLLSWFLIICGCASHPPNAAARRDIQIADIHGEIHAPLHNTNAKATVLLFITNDCPISNSYAPHINALVDEYQPRRVRFYLVHVDPTITSELAATHAREFGFAAPVLLDRTHELVRAVGASVTPEAAIVLPSGQIAYAGRIDDRYTDYGKRRAQPGTHDLRNAIDAVLQDKPVAVQRTAAIGCFIPPLSGARR